MATTMLAGCGSTAADTGAAPAETKATEEKTEAADTEAETDTKEDVYKRQEKKGTSASPATALASRVLPVPGGPTSLSLIHI